LYLLALNAKKVVEESVPGDFAELGVYKGNSAKILHSIAEANGRRIYLFDTFAGFTAEETVNASPNVVAAFKDTSLEAVQQFIGDKGATFVPGKFPDSLTSDVKLEKLALVHIDCDLYEPMKAGLNYFYDKVSSGGLFVLHDYASGHWPGIRRAIDEFLDDKPERLIVMPDKSGTVVFRKI
jgi:hypothetical protein